MTEEQRLRIALSMERAQAHERELQHASPERRAWLETVTPIDSHGNRNYRPDPAGWFDGVKIEEPR